MSHSITPPRRDLTHAVVDGDGYALSWHRSAAAAEREIEREYRAFRRRYPADGSRGNATAYLPRTVIAIPAGGCYVSRIGQYSTTWRAS